VQPIDELQLWLLSKMSATDRVAIARSRLGASEHDMASAAAAVFDTPGHAAAEYASRLAPPLFEIELGRGDTADAFVGSIRRGYQLPLWPEVPLIVCEHPRGYAWGVEFEQAPGPSPIDLDAVAPWRCAANALTAAATTIEILDRWTWDLEAILGFRTPAAVRRFRARFDVGLLQRWAEEH